MAVITSLKYTQYFLHATFCVCALLPLPRVHCSIQLLYRLLLIGWFCVNIQEMGSMVAQMRWNMAYFVGCALFMLNAAANVLVIGEAHFQQRRYMRLLRLHGEIDVLLQTWLRIDVRAEQQRDSSLLRNMWLLLLLHFACDLIKMFITLFDEVTSVFWLYLPVELILRMRYVQINVMIMEMNQRVHWLMHSMQQQLAASHRRAHLDIWRPYAMWEYERLQAIRYIYGRMYKAYMLVNRCFGWSLLTVLITAFFDFVCNAFWCFQESISNHGWNVLVYNGCTSLTFASLIWSMFWYTNATWENVVGQLYTHASASMLVAHNIRLTREFLRRLPPSQFDWRMRLAHITMVWWELCLRVYGVIPLVRYRAVNVCYTCAWLLLIGYMLYLARERHKNVELRLLSHVVHMLLFLTKLSAHVIVLLDSLHVRPSADVQRTLEMETEHVHHVLQQLRMPFRQAHVTWTATKQIILLSILLTNFHWAILCSLQAASTYYWYSLLSSVALQCKIVGICIPLAYYNGYAAILQHNVTVMGKRNLRRMYNLSAIERSRAELRKLLIVQPAEIVCSLSIALRGTAALHHPSHLSQHHRHGDGDGNERELLQLRLLKRLHSEVYRLLQLFSVRNGWSLLAFSTLCFTELVCHAYWIVLTLITDNDVHTYVQSFTLLLIGAMLLVMVCWLAQQSSNHSRNIGCLSYKLVKPLGNKQYNDLVSEFSLQVLHQQFTITAKEFFNFNLSLLGKMVAAIVTYLVILLQFMFTEKSAIDRTANLNIRPLSNATNQH